MEKNMSTPSTAGTTIAGSASFTEKLMLMICSDIEESKFASQLGTTVNHPAFVLGHLAYYFGVCKQLLGGEVHFQDDEHELYAHGATCQEDASIYLDKDTAIQHYQNRLEEALSFVQSCDAEVFDRSTAGNPFEGRMDTLGQVAAFMLTGHAAFHIGQLSAWRRIAGMGPASK